MVEAKSIRRAALQLFGAIEKRGIIRRVLKRVATKLQTEGLIPH
ncbi:MAG: hypothetical protein ACK4M3_02105 [Pyrobaculum sp.]